MVDIHLSPPVQVYLSCNNFSYAWGWTYKTEKSDQAATSIRLSTSLLGGPLMVDSSVQALQDENNEDVPALFRESMAVLRQQGLQTRGLFQTKADPRKVQLLERAWDQGRNPLQLAHVQDVVAVGHPLYLTWLWAKSDKGRG